VKLIAQAKPDTTPEQADALKRTLETANAAANYASQRAWETKTFGQYALHHLVYREVREQFGLSAQMTVRVISKVADAYKLDRKTLRIFKPLSSIAYDDRILSWRFSDQTVSLWTLDGRLRIPFLAGDRQLALLQTMRGEADLVYRDGQFFLYQTCNVEEPPPGEPDGFLGVDLGVVNIAATSDGETFSGKAINNVRARFARLRTKLQKKGTKSAKRLLKKRRRRERRFQQNVNHVIAKALVAQAKDTGRGIALEDLKHIRSRVTVRKSQRRVLHSWAFFDLRAKIEYKARLAGVKVVLVDPRNTSRTCPLCGCIDKKSRRTQSQFSCTGCGYSAPADQNAACIIAGRAAVILPNVAALAG